MDYHYKRCFVADCTANSRQNPERSFFSLPVQMDMLEQWATNMSCPDLMAKSLSARKHYRVCDLHFEKKCFRTVDRKHLLCKVLPTIFGENLITNASMQKISGISPTTNKKDSSGGLSPVISDMALDTPQISTLFSSGFRRSADTENPTANTIVLASLQGISDIAPTTNKGLPFGTAEHSSGLSPMVLDIPQTSTLFTSRTRRPSDTGNTTFLEVKTTDHLARETILEHTPVVPVPEVISLPPTYNNPRFLKSSTRNVNRASTIQRRSTIGSSRASGSRSLRNLHTTRACNLGPRARRLYESNKLCKKFVSHSKQVKRIQQSLKVIAAEKNSCLFKKTLGPLDNQTKDFLLWNIRKSGKANKKRRFTHDEKVIALTLLKKLRGSYRYLAKDFVVPTVKTLKTLLQKTAFYPGINVPLMNHLKFVREPNHPACVLLFNKVHLQMHLAHDEKEDIIRGFEHFGTVQRPVFAEHALVFMLRGLHSNWKQPIAYMFVGSVLQEADLLRCINEVLEAAFSANFQVVATVCNQNSVNVKTIATLKKQYQADCIRAGRDFRPEIFTFQGREIVHLFDPPHLLRGLRNHLLDKDLVFDNDKYRATWQDIINFYEYDSTTCVRCWRLSDQHVYPKQIPKASFDHCAQALSRSVYVGIALLLREAREGVHNFAPTAEGTAKLIGFVDSLFDSVNGTLIFEEGRCRELRRALRKNSKHLEFWHEAKQMLKGMKFIKKTGGSVRPPTLAHWVVTLEGFEYLWQSLQRIGFIALSLRRCNQDVLEHFIGGIRSHLGANRKPSSSSFITSYQTLNINNFMFVHPLYTTQEKEFPLTTFKKFLTQSLLTLPNLPPHDDTDTELDTTARRWDRKVTAYIAGFVAKRVIHMTKACERCKIQLLTTDNSQMNARQFTRNGLTRPNTNFMNAFDRVMKVIYDVLPRHCHQKGIKARIIKCVFDNNVLSFLSCEGHNISKAFVDVTVQFAIHVYCRYTNRLLKGKGTRLHHIVDPIQRLAFERHQTLRGKNRK